MLSQEAKQAGHLRCNRHHPRLLLSGVTKGSHNVVAHGSDGLHGVDLLHQSHGRVVVQHRLGLGAEVAKALGDGGEVVVLALDQRLASDLRLYTHTRKGKRVATSSTQL